VVAESALEKAPDLTVDEVVVRRIAAARPAEWPHSEGMGVSETFLMNWL
jgi:hypothetical protein